MNRARPAPWGLQAPWVYTGACLPVGAPDASLLPILLRTVKTDENYLLKLYTIEEKWKTYTQEL